GNTPR
ncbi:peptidase MA superfamily protein, partial [Vibrio parahaemolyticus V-223/04]